MIKPHAKVRVRYGLRRGATGLVLGTSAGAEKTHHSLVLFRVKFGEGDVDWYEAKALEFVEDPNNAHRPLAHV